MKESFTEVILILVNRKLITLRKQKLLSKQIFTIFVLFKIEFAENFSSKLYLQVVTVISNLGKHISTNRHKLKPNNKEVIHL